MLGYVMIVRHYLTITIVTYRALYRTIEKYRNLYRFSFGLIRTINKFVTENFVNEKSVIEFRL